MGWNGGQEPWALGCVWRQGKQACYCPQWRDAQAAPGPEWFRDAVSESSVATVLLALAVQGNHEHRDVVVGHLPFRRETVVLPLCAVYQHLGQL